MDVTELIDRYCRVWNEGEPNVRAELLASLWSENATYTDPSVHAANGQELLVHIAAIRAGRPGASILRTSPVDIHHRVARFSWHAVEGDGKVLREGIDIAFITSDGSRIERMIGFFGPTTPGGK